MIKLKLTILCKQGFRLFSFKDWLAMKKIQKVVRFWPHLSHCLLCPCYIFKYIKIVTVHNGRRQLIPNFDRVRKNDLPNVLILAGS